MMRGGSVLALMNARCSSKATVLDVHTMEHHVHKFH